MKEAASNLFEQAINCGAVKDKGHDKYKLMMQVNNRRVIEVYQVHRPERKQVHHPAASLPQPGVNHETMKTEMQDDSTQPPNCFEESCWTCTPTVLEVDTVNATAAASTAPTLPADHPLASPPRSRSPRPTAGKAGTRATPMDLLPDTQLWPDGGTIVIDFDEPMLHPPT